MKNRDVFSLEETFWATHGSPVEGPEGVYANEVLVPFVRRTSAAAHASVSAT